MTDATLIAADASLDSLIHNDPEQAKKEAEARQRRGTFDGQAQQQLSNQTHRSRTDPDATLAQKQGTPRQLKYKVHQTIDADSRIILDTEVTTGAGTTTSRISSSSSARDQYQITIREATADRGYGSAEIIKALQGKEPRRTFRCGIGACGSNYRRSGGLVYEREHDRIRCAAGKYLYPSAGDYWNRKRYSSSPGQCRDCPTGVDLCG